MYQDIANCLPRNLLRTLTEYPDPSTMVLAHTSLADEVVRVYLRGKAQLCELPRSFHKRLSTCGMQVGQWALVPQQSPGKIGQ